MIAPVILEDAAVRLEPMTHGHVPALVDAAADGELWNLWYTSVPDPASMRAAVEQALVAQRSGHELPFAIRLKATGAIVGSTRYMHIAEEHRRLEIGSTWISKSSQRSVVNPATKLLLLAHAFEGLLFNRVEFLTHSQNAQSRAALSKLGAVQEGILRRHKVLPNGALRDSVVFSVITDDWPGVRSALQARVARYLPMQARK